MKSYFNLYSLKMNSCENSFGGKGRSLIQLKKLGISVPNTILFRLDEIQNFLKENIKNFSFLLESISFWEIQTNMSEPSTLKVLRDNILSLEMPKNWDQIFLKIQNQLGNMLIVRSSMNIEDQESESLAGCFDSIVVKNLDAKTLWKSVVQVLASAFKSTSILRILESGISPQQLQTGFFIQQWVSPVVAGVCFSRNPTNLWEKIGHVEWGDSGEDVVQGKGNTQFAKQKDPCPEPLQDFLDKLWNYTHALERYICSPVDLEWVWDGNKLWIVQVRPIATEESLIVKNTVKGRKWSRELTLERFPEPITPLGWTALEDVFSANIRILNRDFGIIVKNIKEAGISFGGYIFANPDLFQFPSSIKIRWSHYLSPWKNSFWKLVGVCGKFFYERFFCNSKILSTSLVKIKIINIILGPKADKEIQGWNSHRDTYLKKLEIFNEKLVQVEKFQPIEVLKAMEELRILSMAFMEPDISIYLMKDVTFKCLKDLWMKLGYSELDFTDLVDCFEGNRTMQMSDEWQSLVSYLRIDPGCSHFLEQLTAAHSYKEGLKASVHLEMHSQKVWNAFLKRNGHIRTSWDLEKPSWREDPSQLVHILKQFMQGEQRNIVKTSEKREQACAKLFDGLQNAKYGALNSIVKKSLVRLEGLMKIDEEQHFLSGVLFEPSRKLVLRAEKIFQERKLLHEPGSIFFLKLSELKKHLLEPTMNLHFLVLRRRFQWKQNKAFPKPMELPPKVTKNEFEDFSSLKSNSENILFNGKPVSPGYAEGPIHFVEHIEDTVGIPKGAILVTTSPNPSFTPIYPILSGMITVTGGSLSHGFIAAREYGLPVVSGVSDAFQKFSSGMLVRLDGSKGTIESIN